MPRRRQPFGLPPAPPMAQAHGHPNTPQAPDRVAAARAAARLMQVPRGRRNATALSVGLTHPPPGARCDAPGGRPQGLALVPLPLAPRVVTAARQGTDDVALTRRLPGRGRPLTGRGGCQRRGPARAPRGRGLCAAVDRGPEAGPRRRQQGLQHLPTRKTAVEPQALQAETPGDQPRQAGTPHTIPGRRGPHPPARQVQRGGLGARQRPWQRSTSVSGHSWRCDGSLRRRGAASTVPGSGTRSSALAPPRPRWPTRLGHRRANSACPWTARALQVATLLRPRAQHRRSRRGACTRMTGWGDGAARGRSTPQDAPQVTALHRPWHGQRPLVQGVAGQGVHLFALPGLLRVRRHRDVVV